MKLRNKKTGEIIETDDIFQNGYKEIRIRKMGIPTDRIYEYRYKTFTEFTEEWEGYEEPKEVWYIDFQGVIRSASREENDWFKESEIGNCFETKEEAEKAVEKLKAWKRLKDKGFDRVFGVELGDALCGGKTVAFKLLIDDKDSIEDIKLLFGVEE